jgi:signal peptidase II
LDGNKKKPLALLLLIVIAIVAADQATKYAAQSKLLKERFFERTDTYPCCLGGEQDLARSRFVRSQRNSVSVIDGFFNLKYVENCASAFGMMGNLSESVRFRLLIIVTFVAILFILPFLYQKTPPDQHLTIYGLSFLQGGAIGNLVDRLVHRYVIDFVDWYIIINGKPIHWATFNVADVAIVIGMGLVLLQMALGKRTS